jgi:hypothetical protein
VDAVLPADVGGAPMRQRQYTARVARFRCAPHAARTLFDGEVWCRTTLGSRSPVADQRLPCCTTLLGQTARRAVDPRGAHHPSVLTEGSSLPTLKEVVEKSAALSLVSALLIGVGVGFGMYKAFLRRRTKKQ